MSRDSDTTKAPTITEDLKVKTNLKTIVSVLGAVIVGTAFFVVVMQKLDAVDKKIDAYGQDTRLRINYLYYITKTPNPFEINANAVPNPFPIPPATAP